MIISIKDQVSTRSVLIAVPFPTSFLSPKINRKRLSSQPRGVSMFFEAFFTSIIMCFATIKKAFQKKERNSPMAQSDLFKTEMLNRLQFISRLRRNVLTSQLHVRRTVENINRKVNACGHKNFFGRASTSADSCNRCRQHLAKLSSIEEDMSKYEELDRMLRDYELITILELQDFEIFAQNMSSGTSPES